MKINITIFILSLTFVITMPLAHSYTTNCANANDQYALNECVSNDYKNSDSELNKLYKEIRKRLAEQPDSIHRLVAAQRAWISFRDAECNFVSANLQGGSSYGMIKGMCLSRLTQTRIKDLKTYLSCEEGELDCPVPPKE